MHDLKSGEPVQEDDQREAFYLREMARVDGKPKMVSERYLGSAEDIAAAMAGHDQSPDGRRMTVPPGTGAD